VVGSSDVVVAGSSDVVVAGSSDVLLLLKAEQSSASEPTPWYSQPSLQHSSIVR